MGSSENENRKYLPRFCWHQEVCGDQKSISLKVRPCGRLSSLVGNFFSETIVLSSASAFGKHLLDNVFFACAANYISARFCLLLASFTRWENGESSERIGAKREKF
jgi:hypothetical protein